MNVFPKLEELSFTVGHDTPLQWTPHRHWVNVILSPSITRLRIHFNTDPPATAAKHHITVLSEMLQAAENLKLSHLEIGAKAEVINTSALVLSAVAALIAGQPGLNRLVVLDFPDQLLDPFQGASHLEQLEDLHFGISDGPEDWPFANRVSLTDGISGFRSLLRLRIEANVHEIRPILRSVESSNLRALTLEMDPLAMDPPGGPLGRPLPDIKRFTQLTQVCLMFPHLRGTWDAFGSLLSCGDLQTVGLIGGHIAAIVGDSQVRDMARAWPGLLSLTIIDCHLRRTRSTVDRNVGTGGEYPPAATLLGLSVFAIHCPSLRQLTIPIDARGPSDSKDLQSIGYSVEWLLFPDSWVDEELGVATFIGRMWPNHRHPTERVRSCCGPQMDADYDERWKTIWRLAGETASGPVAGWGGPTQQTSKLIGLVASTLSVIALLLLVYF